jgi:phosphatidylinositol glycan class M
MVTPGFKVHLYFAFAIRSALIFYGDYQDRSMEVKYTDVDYRVFTDAARHIWEDESPYNRHTYRYTPLLAWLLLPNVTLSPLFGKFLFCGFDIIAAYLIYASIKGDGYGESWARKCAWLWLYNPLVMAVSSRGNADSIVVALVLATLSLYRERVFLLTGIAFGLAIHFKLYPVIFCLPMYVALTDKTGFRGFFHVNSARVRLVAGTVVTLAVLTAICYSLYGMEFINEAYLHHLTRKDTRHNFSVYFYMLYLTVEEDDIGLSLITFVPQMILLLGLTKKFGNINDMPFCILCQTFVFVVYNKVCTSQYFLWYLAQLAIVLPQLRLTKSESLILLLLWGFTQGSWLLPAYFLEFKGYNTFQFIWIESMAFFCANVGIMSKCVRKYRENSRDCSGKLE